jgi:hypothetical protein
MPLSRRDKFALKSQMIDTIDSDRSWDFQRINLFLTEYGCAPLGGYGNEDFTFADSIADLSDTDLLELFSVVVGVEPEDARRQIESTDSPIWKSGYVRVFLSHSAHHKRFVGEVADELAVSGIHAFVAHDTMEVEQPWQEQIESALRSMQAFVAILHPETSASAWCQQEIGWALGRGTPHYVLRAPTDPAGFIGRTQWPQAQKDSAKQMAHRILEWVSRSPEFSDQIIDGLLTALAEADNYIDAGATARRIATIDTLTDEHWTRLAEIYHSNDQVARAVLVRQELAPFYQRHSRDWPPGPTTLVL